MNSQDMPCHGGRSGRPDLSSLRECGGEADVRWPLGAIIPLVVLTSAGLWMAIALLVMRLSHIR